MDQLDFFFSNSPEGGKQSTLAFALGKLQELKTKELENSQAYCMYWWSVLDMLSRFYSGQLDNQRATKRLKDFLKDFFPHKHGETNTLIHFRNACMHSVNLYSSDQKGGGELRFKLLVNGDFLAQQGNTVSVNTSELAPRLVTAIDKFKTKLQSDPLLQKRFEKVYRKMGYVRI